MLSEVVFGKPLNEIELSDLETFFIDEQEESSILEFKTGQVTVDGLYKEVCAFLNTEGGVIVVGAPREDKKTVGKNSEIVFCKGKLTPTHEIRGKDWLLMKIRSNISPAPIGINIQEFITPEGNCFIIDVAQSVTPPHQNNLNGVYHIRLEREAKHAPHGLVEAMFSRRQKPKLEISGGFAKNKDGIHTDIHLILRNISPYPTEKVSYSISIMNIKDIPGQSGSGHVISKNDEGTATFAHVTDTILWESMEINVTYTFLPLDEPFVYSISTWSKDARVTRVRGIGIVEADKVTILEKDGNSSEEPKGIDYYLELLESHKKQK